MRQKASLFSSDKNQTLDNGSRYEKSYIMDATNKSCRNCGESEFYSRDVSLMLEASALLPIGIFSSRDIHVRVCGHSGLMECFVAPVTLAKVKEKFSKDA